MKISPARKSAFEILNKIEKEKAFSSVLLPIYEAKLESKDKGLCHEIVLGVLRKKLFLDEIIKKLTKKKLNKFDSEVLNSLRIGLYQLLFLDKIPTYSAINESVEIVKFAKKSSASGLVNAVLRKASKEKFSFEFADEFERIALETSHPVWLIEKWSEQFSIVEAEKIATANNENVSMTFRLTERFYRKDAESQREILKDFEESKLVENSYLVKKFDGNLRNLSEKGLIYFQDEGSQIVAQSVELKEDESFLDVCASPGSKATYIARQKAKGKRENLLIAGDFYWHRVQNLKTNCSKQGVNSVEIVQYDAMANLPFVDESFDVVLVDAPCTGTGTIRHNPEIRYHLNEKDCLELSEKQLAILKNASKLVKKGGRIIYSTCSLEIEENESVIENFLSEHSEFETMIPNLSANFITDKKFARISPQLDNSDGFFIAVLKRIGSL